MSLCLLPIGIALSETSVSFLLVASMTFAIISVMQQFVAYYRVSTDRQGQSGLGLDAQRQAVAQHVQDGPLLAEFEEIESGKRHNNRPQLAAAIEQCRRSRATLVIAKLDRLARNVHFISGLMESNVQFVCCDNPYLHTRDHNGRMMLHQMAMMAEWEAGAISQRTKAALQQVKRELAEKGQRVSVRGRVFTRLGNPPGIDLSRARAKRHPVKPSPQTIALMHDLRAKGMTYRAIAAHLDSMDIRTPRGCRWHFETIRDLIARTMQEQPQ